VASKVRHINVWGNVSDYACLAGLSKDRDQITVMAHFFIRCASAKEEGGHAATLRRKINDLIVSDLFVHGMDALILN
jgi:hypothetical protein